MQCAAEDAAVSIASASNMDTIGAAFAVLRTGVRFNRKADRGTGGGSQVCVLVLRCLDGPYFLTVCCEVNAVVDLAS